MRPTLISLLKKHIPQLDGLRGVAILLVMFHHLIPYRPAAHVLGKLLNAFQGIGWAGVDLFFVLSGFLITGILHDAKGSDSFFTNFYARRILRIFPLYYTWLFLCTAVFSHFAFGHAAAPADHQWMWWLYVSNYESAFLGNANVWIGLFWSLAVEEHFYLVWPALIRFSSRRQALAISSFLVLVASAFRAYFILHGNHAAPYFWTFCRMDDLAFGAIVALLMRGSVPLHKFVVPARVIGAITGVVALALTIACHAVIWKPIMQLVALPAFGIFFGCALILTVIPDQSHGLRRVLNTRFLRTFGKYSYGLYIFHPAVGYFIERLRLLPARMVLANDLLMTMIAISISFAIAYASFNLFEQRFLKLKKYFSYRPVNKTVEKTADVGVLAA